MPPVLAFFLALVTACGGGAGAIILTNSSILDPAVELQQNWTRMQKVSQ